MLTDLQVVLPGALPVISDQHFLYCIAILLDIYYIDDLPFIVLNALAVAICITVSSEYLQLRSIFKAEGPFPPVILANC